MNNLENTIDDAIQFWQRNTKTKMYTESMVDYIVRKTLSRDPEFESALYQIVTEKLNQNG
jgi:hypothetical protein